MDMAGHVFATVARRHGPSAGNADTAFFAAPTARFWENFSYRGKR
jgi:hypothetical protein